MKSTSDCAISPIHMRKSCRPLKSAEKRFLMYGYFLNMDEDEPWKYSLRDSEPVHRLCLQKARYCYAFY